MRELFLQYSLYYNRAGPSVLTGVPFKTSLSTFLCAFSASKKINLENTHIWVHGWLLGIYHHDKQVPHSYHDCGNNRNHFKYKTQITVSKQVKVVWNTNGNINNQLTPKSLKTSLNTETVNTNENQRHKKHDYSTVKTLYYIGRKL